MQSVEMLAYEQDNSDTLKQLKQLSGRELLCLSCLASGFNNQETRSLLGLTESGLREMKRRITFKTSSRTLQQAIALNVRAGLLFKVKLVKRQKN